MWFILSALGHLAPEYETIVVYCIKYTSNIDPPILLLGLYNHLIDIYDLFSSILSVVTWHQLSVFEHIDMVKTAC